MNSFTPVAMSRLMSSGSQDLVDACETEKVPIAASWAPGETVPLELKLRLGFESKVGDTVMYDGFQHVIVRLDDPKRIQSLALVDASHIDQSA